MKGKVTKVDTVSVNFKDGTRKDKYVLHIEGDDKVYECWSAPPAVGDEIDGEVTSRDVGGIRYYGIKLQKKSGGYSGGGFRGGGGGATESFAAAYSKDIVVAFIKDNPNISSEAVKSMFVEYAEAIYTWMQSKKA